MPPPLFVFLVSGRPAGGSPPGTDDTFARCAWLRVAELVRVFHKNRKKAGAVVTDTTVLRFIHFASHDSSVGIYEHDLATMANKVRDPLANSVSKNWVTLDSSFKTKFGSLTPKTEDPKDFVEWKEVSVAKANNPTTWGRDDDPSPNVSIVNVYHSVRKAPPGSVLELSIFSHAFVDGPVLNNTSSSSATSRSPGDTDGRALIDFQGNMGESGTANKNALDEFRNAFHSTGSFRIWGCNIQDLVETIPPPDDIFRDFDIANAAALITKLQSDTDPATQPVSQFLFSKIDSATKKLFADPAKPLSDKQTALVKALNKILNGSSIGDKTRFAGVTLRPVTQSVLTQSLSFAPHRISQNRLLIEDAYPSELRRRPAFRCLIMSTVRQVVEEAFVSPLKVGGSIGTLLRDNKKMPSGTTNITLNMDRAIDHELSIQRDPHAGHGFSSFVRFRLFEIRYDESFTNHAYHAFFQGERTGSDFAKKITRTLSDIVKFVAAETTKSYFFLAAKGLKSVTVVGGAPGTSAELNEVTGQQEIGSARLNEAKFFSKFFDVSITDPNDEVQRHYAIFDNQGNAVKTILDREKNGLP